MSALHLVEAIQAAVDAERQREHDRENSEREKRAEVNDAKRDRLQERELLALEVLGSAFSQIAEELRRFNQEFAQIRCNGISVRR